MLRRAQVKEQLTLLMMIEINKILREEEVTTVQSNNSLLLAAKSACARKSGSQDQLGHLRHNSGKFVLITETELEGCRA